MNNSRRLQIIRIISAGLVGITLSAQALALDIASLSNADAVSGLKDALTQGAAAAIGKLGVENGFLGNDKVKIPLPDAIKRIESGLRLLGMQRQADELVVAMNRAAEQAVPEARALLVGAVKNMSVQDAKGILTGGDTAANRLFPPHDERPAHPEIPADRHQGDEQGRARGKIQQSGRPGRATGPRRREAGEDRKLRDTENPGRPLSHDCGAGEGNSQGPGRLGHGHGAESIRAAGKIAGAAMVAAASRTPIINLEALS